AELVENAVSFSPPQTAVRVGGSSVGDTFVIEVEDRGLGMSAEQRARGNAELARPSEFTLSGTAQLGLYVVSRLAERHGIQVTLTESPYGGTTAVVTLPAALVTDSPRTGRAAIDDRDDDAQLATIGANAAAPAAPSRTSPSALSPSGLPVRRKPGA